MPDSSKLPRLYDEREVGKILERATEIQRQEPARAAEGGGLSLEELEEIALEAGIDPRHLRRAAVELDTGEIDPSGWDRLVGDHTTLVYEAMVPGELPQDDFEGVVSAIQQVAREHGQPSLLGKTLTWQAETPSKTRSIQVVVSARRGETHIRVEERLHQFASGLFGGIIGGVGGGVGLGVGLPIGLEALGSALFATAFPLGIIGLSYLGARQIYRQVIKRRRAKLAELLDSVTEAVRRSIEDGLLEAPGTPRELPAGEA
jgi:hypothetical protein